MSEFFSWCWLVGWSRLTFLNARQLINASVVLLYRTADVLDIYMSLIDENDRIGLRFSGIGFAKSRRPDNSRARCMMHICEDMTAIGRIHRFEGCSPLLHVVNILSQRHECTNKLSALKSNVICGHEDCTDTVLYIYMAVVCTAVYKVRNTTWQLNCCR